MRVKVILLSCFVFMLVPGSPSKAGEPMLLVEYVFDSNFSDTSGNGLDGIPGGTANAGSRWRLGGYSIRCGESV
jgi:hypothetical protein